MRLSLRATIAALVRQRRRTQATLDTSTGGVVLVDAGRIIVQCNPATERLSGWRADEALGQPCWKVFGCRGATQEEAEAHEQVCPLLRASRQDTEQAATEMHVLLRDGQRRWFAVSCAPLPGDEQATEQRLVVDIHDISQLKAVEQVKSDFVTMVSHELRAPLTTVTGAVETLGLLDPTSERETFHEVVGILQQQTQRPRQVVEEVLQVTRFEAGRLEAHLQPLPLRHFLRGLVEKVRAEWSEGDHSLVSSESPSEILVWADAALLEIVLRNLFENARKYTPAGTAVEIEAGSVADSGQVEIRVIDHGPGIPADQLEHLFERFSRGTQSPEGWTRGYGLGLYIARDLMLAHNGSIRAENREQGTCFVLSLWAVTDDLHSSAGEAGTEEVEAQEKGYVR